ncbi:putative motility protein [Treponema sp. R80B11-R83G3]
MDIQSLSINMSQIKVQEQAAVQVQAMGLNMIKEQAAALDKLLSTVQSIIEPNMGKNVDLLV